MRVSRIKWNFTKFLVDRRGKVVGRYAPTTTPEALEAEVAKVFPVCQLACAVREAYEASLQV